MYGINIKNQKNAEVVNHMKKLLVAWATVKQTYKKGSSGNWEKK